ncbi:MAG: ATP-binding protein [Cyanobacteria bacterium J06632_3]
MMQTFLDLITDQIVSLSVYQRLRDSLLQQSGLFESVTTEAQWLATHRSEQHGRTEEPVGMQFVLLRSPAFNVLLTATPTEESADSRVNSVSADGASGSTASGHSASSHTASSHTTSSHTVSSIAKTSKPSGFASHYRLSFTFDNQIIKRFLHQLPASHLKTKISADLSNQPTHRESSGRQAEQEAFILSWAKDLASSQNESAQPTQDALTAQIQQSLLLNQVITRIRHSLDLPSILETTVAQVREFLSADRLVLYQFDQLDSVDLSYLLKDKPDTAEEGLSHAGDSSDLSEQSNLSERSVDGTRQHNGERHTVAPTVGATGGTVIGRCLHEGHVTYESRISEEIPSVLHFSEKDCFHPQWSLHSRFLLGQPIAIDDVEVRYADVECLLNFLRQAQVKSKIIAPIVVKDQLWGLLIAHQCRARRQWKDTEGIFLQHIAEHLAVAIDQAALYQQLRQQTASLESCVIERTQNLHDALMAAESANLTKGEFLSTMSHELRTPLTYIIGMSATLLRWSFGELSDRQRNYLTTINHSGEQLLTVINDILEFAKVESGRSLLDFSQFSLSEAINKVISHYQPLAEKQRVGLSLSFSVAAKNDSFIADAKRFQQILSNLVHNAIKFTPADGHVSVQVWQEAQMSVFQVTDSGIGIPESQKDLLFEKFKQLESPFQRRYSGTGLGLAMTKRLVELHGGSIHVESVVGKGSVFTVRLPVRKTDNAEARYEVPRTLGTNARRVLLLETEEDSAGIICDLLTADGYEVIWSVEVDQLLAQLSSLQPVMLIADLSLLSHNLEDIKSIQLSITALGAKVLALLSQPISQSSHIAHHDTLEKPIDPKALLEKTRQLTLQH